MRTEAITLHEGHAAVNVKKYNLHTPDGFTEADAERAWDWTVEQFWDDAAQLAHERGYTGVFAEGRSGGWLVPYHWSKGAPKHQYHGAYRQGPDVGYPVFPDVAHDGAERERFRAFERRVRRMLADVQADYEGNLAQAKEVREEEYA